MEHIRELQQTAYTFFDSRVILKVFNKNCSLPNLQLFRDIPDNLLHRDSCVRCPGAKPVAQTTGVVIWVGLRIVRNHWNLTEDNLSYWKYWFQLQPFWFFLLFYVWSHSLKPMWTWTQIHFGNFSCQPHLLIKSVKGEDAVEPLVIRYSLKKWIYWSPIVKRYPNILPFETSWKIQLFSANVQILNFEPFVFFILKSTNCTHEAKF